MIQLLQTTIFATLIIDIITNVTSIPINKSNTDYEETVKSNRIYTNANIDLMIFKIAIIIYIICALGIISILILSIICYKLYHTCRQFYYVISTRRIYAFFRNLWHYSIFQFSFIFLQSHMLKISDEETEEIELMQQIYEEIHNLPNDSLNELEDCI